MVSGTAGISDLETALGEWLAIDIDFSSFKFRSNARRILLRRVERCFCLLTDSLGDSFQMLLYKHDLSNVIGHVLCDALQHVSEGIIFARNLLVELRV